MFSRRIKVNFELYKSHCSGFCVSVLVPEQQFTVSSFLQSDIRNSFFIYTDETDVNRIALKAPDDRIGELWAPNAIFGYFGLEKKEIKTGHRSVSIREIIDKCKFVGIVDCQDMMHVLFQPIQTKEWRVDPLNIATVHFLTILAAPVKAVTRFIDHHANTFKKERCNLNYLFEEFNLFQKKLDQRLAALPYHHALSDELLDVVINDAFLYDDLETAEPIEEPIEEPIAHTIAHAEPIAEPAEEDPLANIQKRHENVERKLLIFFDQAKKDIDAFLSNKRKRQEDEHALLLELEESKTKTAAIELRRTQNIESIPPFYRGTPFEQKIAAVFHEIAQEELAVFRNEQTITPLIQSLQAIPPSIHTLLKLETFADAI